MTQTDRVTSTDYENPYRPLLLRAVNGMGKGAGALGWRPSLEMESILSAACRAEKKEHFTDASFMEPLRVLLEATEEQARLHFFGRFAARQRIINVLKNRLRLETLLEARPEICDIALPAVILVTGLQRTGTTKLHRLLAADPETRSLASWEAVNPVPLCEDRAKDTARRLKVAVQSQKALSFLAPDFFAIHPVEADAPEEDVLLLDYAFLSTVPESMMHVPTYAGFAESTDNRPAYEYMRRLLQVLQWHTPKKRWVLKTPHHLEFLSLFLDVFPDTTVVQTHRDPAQTLPSFCSMIAHCHGVFTNRVKPKEIGRHWLRKTARLLNRGMTARMHLDADRVVDVQYEALLADPMAQVERIYRSAEVNLSPLARDAMTQCLKVNVMHRYGVHQYEMEPFGLTIEMIRQAYGDYLERFDL